jgi:hypothetical protein
MSDACAIPIKMAEAKIRAILLALDAELVRHGDTIEAVRVDTRNFAGMRVEISTAKLRLRTSPWPRRSD